MIPRNEIQWRFALAYGATGQDVKKEERQVEILFNVDKSKALNSYQKEFSIVFK